MSDPRFTAIRDLVQEDINQRGLRTDPEDNLITACPNDLEAACHSIVTTSSPSIGILTGFYIPTATPPAGETDGPLGALFLARALTELGIRTVLATDPFCVPALEAGLEAVGLSGQVPLCSLPEEKDLSPSHYVQMFDSQARVTGTDGPALTHWIALERVGPSHRFESVRSQPLAREEDVRRFLQEVSPERHDRCYSMRGRDLTPCMRPGHLLLERARERNPRLTTIGIGDGGNEIGMGKISWDTIRRNIPGGGLIACRVPCDHLIVCGVSNWGAYALAAGIVLLKGRVTRDLFDIERERHLLQIMVVNGPLVDGVTGQPTTTVDGLPFERYVEPLRRLGALLGVKT